jgi:hypothetical protein
MASSELVHPSSLMYPEDTYQLLIVCNVHASCHDLLTWWWIQRSATTGRHTVRAADSDPTGLLCPLQQTANDKLSTWHGHGDSHFHVSIPTCQGSFGVNWTWNFSRVKLSDNVILGVRNVAGKQDTIPDVWYSYSTRCPYMKSANSISKKKLMQKLK